MRATYLWIAALALATGSPALAKTVVGRTAAEEEDEAAPAKTANVSLSLPRGIMAELSLTGGWSAGVYAEGGGGGGGFGGRGGGGRGRRSNDDPNDDRTRTTSSAAGLQARWNVSGQAFTDGWYVSPYAGYMQAKFKSANVDATARAKGATFGLLGGYGWYGRTGVNFQLGLGVRDNALHAGDLDYTHPDGSAGKLQTGRTLGAGATGEVALGFAF